MSYFVIFAPTIAPVVFFIYFLFFIYIVYLQRAKVEMVLIN